MPLTAIYSSDLKRAAFTAVELKKQQQDPDLRHERHGLLREQDFGSGEGRPFSKARKELTISQHHAKGLFPAIYTRHQKFPGGECLEEVEERAAKVFDEILMQHVLNEADDGKQRTVAVVSHGIFIAELISVIKKRDRSFIGNPDIKDLRGMKNTAWTKIQVQLTIVSCLYPHCRLTRHGGIW